MEAVPVGAAPTAQPEPASPEASEPVEVTEEYLRSLELADLLDFLNKNGIQVPAAYVGLWSAEQTVNWVIEQYA
jgi:hypothetical protein